MDSKYNKENISRLIISKLKDIITPEENKILETWVNMSEENKKFFSDICNNSYIHDKVNIISRFNTKKDWNLVSIKLRNKKNHMLLNIARYAAILIIAIGSIGLIRYIVNDIESINKNIANDISDIHPGTYKATLILPGGKTIELEERKDSCININTGSVLINRQNIISYNNSLSSLRTPPKIEWHTMRIPRGGEYMLKLSDGTKVWLNSETEIKYPTIFSGKERKIFISGEAYLEVKKNAEKPFIVSTKDMKIKVLGTSFNVMAYKDETSSRTTLVEGLVEVSTTSADNKNMKLLPGNQALITKGKIDIKKVNTKLFISWRNSRFAFDNEPIESVVKKLSRWYDVEFFFISEDIKNKHFTGSIPKYEDISQILKMLELTTNVKFRICKRVVIIEKGNK